MFPPIRMADVRRRIEEIAQTAAKLERARRLRALEAVFGRRLGQWFKAMGAEIVGLLEPVLGHRFDAAYSLRSGQAQEAAVMAEAITQEEWDYLIDRLIRGDPLELGKVIDAFTGLALAAGGQGLYDNLGVGITFNLENPRAVAYLSERGAAKVGQINEVSRGQLNRLLTQAVAEGRSWTQTAADIRGLFEDFSVRRSEAIARFELGSAYEAGNEMAAQGLQDIGLRMEKSWLTAGDRKVRPAHMANEADGWIAMDGVFSSGDERPPTDPNCRCSLLYRRAQEN